MKGTGTGDELGECGIGEDESVAVDVGVVGEMAIEGDAPRLN